MFESIIKYSEFTCGIILLAFAIIQFVYKERKFINFNIAGLYFSLSYVILIFWALKSGLIIYTPRLLYTDIAAAFTIGPFVYFYIKTVLGIKTGSFFKYTLHFIPAILVFTIIVFNNNTDELNILYYIQSPMDYPAYNQNPLIRWIDFISNFYMIVYFILTIRNIYPLLQKNKHKSMKEIKIVFYFMFFIVLFSALMLVANFFQISILNISAIYLLTLSGIWYLVFSFRYPEFTQNAIKEAKTIRYKNIISASVDADAVIERLEYLLDEEKIFRDEDLTLQKLSSLLMITPHQLSNILNSKRKINFRSLINSYRIKEAMNQMTEYPEKTILEIALASGFNSKSSFNSVFMNSAGVTPSDYRKSLRN